MNSLVDAPPTVSLGIGEIHVTSQSVIISTVLGSCVAVCLHDEIRGVAGMNHYLLPRPEVENGNRSHRFGLYSIREMIQDLRNLGAEPRNLRAKIFGGAHVLAQFSAFKSIPDRNIEIARQILKEAGIRIIAEEVGGDRGRRVHFETGTGKVLVRIVSSRDQL